MSFDRKINALRNLAERPGTEAEGQVARKMLERLTGRAYVPLPPMPPPIPRPPRPAAPRKKRQTPPPMPDFLRDKVKLAQMVRQRFKVGQVVYYSASGYGGNCGGVVMGHQRAGYRVKVFFPLWDQIREVDACSQWG